MNFKITSGIDRSKGIKTVIYGVEGIGKTTLASKFPDPLFIDTEGSTTHFESVKRLPKPETWKQLNEMIDFVSDEKPCKTLVIDTLDWAESAEVADMLNEYKWKSIESAGYGKGYVISAERIAEFLKKLETRLIDRGINVVLTAHCQIKKFEQPEESGQYDRYELKLGAKTGSRTAPLVKEWADMLLFCNYKTYVQTKTDGLKNQTKAVGGTERVIHTQHSAVWDAKNRFGLPEEMPMEFSGLAEIFKAQKNETVKPENKTKHETEPAPIVEEPYQKYDLAMLDLDMTFPTGEPNGVPQDVIDLCQKEGVSADVIQVMLYQTPTISVKDLPFDLRKTPPKFWKSFVEEYDQRWRPLVMKARDARMPF